MNSDNQCDGCRKRVRRFWRFKNLFLCFRCYRKRFHTFPNKGRRYTTLKDALKKEYKVNGYINLFNGRASIQSTISVPSILTGHKVQLVLIK